MYTVTIRDGAVGTDTTQPNLYELLAGIGEIVDRLVWKIASLNQPEKHFLNEFDVVGVAEPEFDALHFSGERISGNDLKALSLKSHQLIWAELRGHSGKETSRAEVIIRVVDSTYFEVVCSDAKIVDRFTNRFKLVEVSSESADRHFESKK